MLAACVRTPRKLIKRKKRGPKRDRLRFWVEIPGSEYPDYIANSAKLRLNRLVRGVVHHTRQNMT